MDRGERVATAAAAAAMLEVARGLARLPHLATAAGRGELSGDQLVELVRIADEDSDERWAAFGDGVEAYPCRFDTEVLTIEVRRGGRAGQVYEVGADYLALTGHRRDRRCSTALRRR